MSTKIEIQEFELAGFNEDAYNSIFNQNSHTMDSTGMVKALNFQLGSKGGVRSSYTTKEGGVRASHASTPAADTFAEEYMARPKIGMPWQVLMALGVISSPALVVGGAIANSSPVTWSGMALSPLSFSCMILINFSDPGGKNTEYFLGSFYIFLLTAVCSTMAYTNGFRNKSGTGTIVASLIQISGLCCLYFAILARRRIGNFSTVQLKEYVYKRVFWDGLGSLPPIIYLTAESISCFLDIGEEDVTIEGAIDQCGGIYFPPVEYLPDVCTVSRSALDLHPALCSQFFW